MSVDNVTLSVVSATIQRICREMRGRVHRSGQSFLIAQSNDISCGLWTRDGATIAMPNGITPHFLAGKFSVQYINEQYGDDIGPGDVFLSNDPYRGYTSHPPDWGFFRPIFVGGEHKYWTMVRVHMEDSGAAFPGDYYPRPADVQSEGLLIPAVRIQKGGVPNREVLALIWNNLRLPENVQIDSHAAMAGTALAESRFVELIERYGVATVDAVIEELADRTEEVTRGRIRALPDGVYSGESFTDDNGVDPDVPVAVRVRVTVRGDDLSLDFSESDPQQPGYVNATWQTTFSMAMAGVALFLGADIGELQNEGLMRAVKVFSPEGLVTNPRYPAPCGGAPINVGHNVIESVMMALSAALPDRSMAGWGRRFGQYIAGRRPDGSGMYVYPGYEAEGGSGAVWGHDGFHGTGSVATLGEIIRPNTESIENRFPWRIHCREFRLDSCGAGRWRGGAGFVWEAENLGGDASLTSVGQGETTSSHGVHGGFPTPPNTAYVRRRHERFRIRAHDAFALKQGDILHRETGGGGGVGRPEERDVELVLRDVVDDELISVQTARDIYAVVIDEATLTVDWSATRTRREQRAAERGAV